jgi:uncharacterized protein
MTATITVTGNVPKKPIIIEAFPSRGYVSTIAASQMIKQLQMEQVGYMECDKLDAVAVVHDGVPMHPIRIYMKGDLILLFSELIIPLNLVHEFTVAIGEWFKTLNPSYAVLLASVPGVETDKEHEMLAITTDPSAVDKIKALGLKQMQEGVLSGMSSSLMIKCSNLGIPATSLMVETNYVPDVLAAASLLKIISELLSLKLSADDLNKAGKDIEVKFRSSMDQMKTSQDNVKEMHQEMSMYR